MREPPRFNRAEHNYRKTVIINKWCALIRRLSHTEPSSRNICIINCLIRRSEPRLSPRSVRLRSAYNAPSSVCATSATAAAQLAPPRVWLGTHTTSHNTHTHPRSRGFGVSENANTGTSSSSSSWNDSRAVIRFNLITGPMRDTAIVTAIIIWIYRAAATDHESATAHKHARTHASDQ